MDRNVGAAQQGLHRLADALASYQHAAAIGRTLVASDPANADWERQLYVTETMLADVQSDLPGRTRDALATLRDGLAIAEKLAAAHPTVAEYHDDVVMAHDVVGQVLLQLHDRRATRRARS